MFLFSKKITKPLKGCCFLWFVLVLQSCVVPLMKQLTPSEQTLVTQTCKTLQDKLQKFNAANYGEMASQPMTHAQCLKITRLLITLPHYQDGAMRVKEVKDCLDNHPPESAMSCMKLLQN